MTAVITPLAILVVILSLGLGTFEGFLPVNKKKVLGIL